MHAFTAFLVSFWTSSWLPLLSVQLTWSFPNYCKRTSILPQVHSRREFLKCRCSFWLHWRSSRGTVWLGILRKPSWETICELVHKGACLLACFANHISVHVLYLPNDCSIKSLMSFHLLMPSLLVSKHNIWTSSFPFLL